MKLMNDFYTVSEVLQTGSRISARIHLNAGHEIFGGHFPGNPVVPGVCMVEIVKEILEMRYKSGFTMTEAADIKFLRAIQPGETPVFNAEISVTEQENKKLDVNARFTSGEVVLFKLKGGFDANP